MSNIINEQILEDLAQEIDNMSNISIINEVLGNSSSNSPIKAGIPDMNGFKNMLMKKRFEEMSR